MSKRIMICTDGSELSRKALEYGLSLAKSLRAEAIILSVTEPYPYGANAGVEVFLPVPAYLPAYEATQKEFAGKTLAAAMKMAKEVRVKATAIHIPDSWPAEAIVQTAKGKACEMIIMGSNGRRGIRRAILGSQTAEVLSLCTVPVLVVR